MQFTRILALGALGLVSTLGVISGCSSEDEDTGSQPGPVGSACKTDADCAGYTNPRCVTEIYPTRNLITDPTHPGAPAFEDLVIPFNGGYCTNDLGDLTKTDIQTKSCTADSCGDGGTCFAPLGSFDDLSGLQATLTYVDVEAFGDLALCLQPCTADSECRESEGYKCLVPLTGLLDVLGVTEKYCMVEKDYSSLLGGGGG